MFYTYSYNMYNLKSQALTNWDMVHSLAKSERASIRKLGHGTWFCTILKGQDSANWDIVHFLFNLKGQASAYWDMAYGFVQY